MKSMPNDDDDYDQCFFNLAGLCRKVSVGKDSEQTDRFTVYIVEHTVHKYRLLYYLSDNFIFFNFFSSPKGKINNMK